RVNATLTPTLATAAVVVAQSRRGRQSWPYALTAPWRLAGAPVRPRWTRGPCGVRGALPRDARAAVRGRRQLCAIAGGRRGDRSGSVLRDLDEARPVAERGLASGVSLHRGAEPLP